MWCYRHTNEHSHVVLKEHSHATTKAHHQTFASGICQWCYRHIIESAHFHVRKEKASKLHARIDPQLTQAPRKVAAHATTGSNILGLHSHGHYLGLDTAAHFSSPSEILWLRITSQT